MAEASVGHQQLKDLSRSERLLVELQRLDGILDGQVRRDGVVSSRNGY